MTSPTQFSVTALLVSALCAACGGRNPAITAKGSAGSGGRTADAAAGTTGAIAGADGGGSGGNTVDAAVETPGAIAGADGGGDLANGAGGAAPPRLAANGVPIPTPALANDSCASLKVQTVACTMDSECEPVSCDCGGTPVVFNKCWNNCVIGCMGKCVTGVSCAAACATTTPSSLTPSQRVLACLTTNPFCKSDADCERTSFPYRCVVPPNAASGECVTGDSGSPCLADTDCQSRVCIVVTPQGLSVCGGPFEQCNTDEQCSVLARTVEASGLGGASGPICEIDAGAFVGFCTPGTERSPCVTQHDCLPSLKCVPITQALKPVCTSGRQGAPCGADADCDSRLCVDHSCSTTKGAQGHLCVTQDDCQASLKCMNINGGYVCTSGDKGAPCGSGTDCNSGFPFCVNQTCSAGATGDHCMYAGDCRGFCIGSTCSDGTLGSPCRSAGMPGAPLSGCVAGLQCADMGSLICVEPASQDAGGQ